MTIIPPPGNYNADDDRFEPTPFERELTRLPTMEEDLPVARNPGTDPRFSPEADNLLAQMFGPEVRSMSDQEIRARALECACKLKAAAPGYDTMALAEQFEVYIRNGK